MALCKSGQEGSKTWFEVPVRKLADFESFLYWMIRNSAGNVHQP